MVEDTAFDLGAFAFFEEGKQGHVAVQLALEVEHSVDYVAGVTQRDVVFEQGQQLLGIVYYEMENALLATAQLDAVSLIDCQVVLLAIPVEDFQVMLVGGWVLTQIIDTNRDELLEHKLLVADADWGEVAGFEGGVDLEVLNASSFLQKSVSCLVHGLRLSQHEIGLVFIERQVAQPGYELVRISDCEIFSEQKFLRWLGVPY